jgi:elongator complex protein 3
MIETSYSFIPQDYEEELRQIIDELDGLEGWERSDYERILRRHPKDGRGFFSKAEILQGFRHLNQKLDWQRDEQSFADVIRMKPVRTLSGVAPVTVLTKPYPCPGRCIFCPSDVRMPKSYLSDEPGAQRAAEHQFDPYRQTFSRLRALHNIGHRVDKVELIVLGGTWSYYPEAYQIWFVRRCFDALNDYGSWRLGEKIHWPEKPEIDFRNNDQRIDGAEPDRPYNQIVRQFTEAASRGDEPTPTTSWSDLEAVQRDNEGAEARCVGLVIETRPDHLDLQEVGRIRRLGATKVQIGFQSLSDKVLELNHRGHDVEATRRSVEMLRQAGFKIHAHWMPNLYGSSPEHDIEDYERIFADPALRPDELKIYPCSLIESAELMQKYRAGEWRPYDHEELLRVLTECMQRTPEYCRLTRVIRDIPGTDIVDGNKLTNFRELAERDLAERGLSIRDIRSREVRDLVLERTDLHLRCTEYDTSVGRERFLQFTTADDRLAAFLRLSLPKRSVPFTEIAESAMIREVHVYGRLVRIGGRSSGRSQHLGLGRELIELAEREAVAAGFSDLAVISSVGTRHYYRSLGFEDGALYQHRACNGDTS